MNSQNQSVIESDTDSQTSPLGTNESQSQIRRQAQQLKQLVSSLEANDQFLRHAYRDLTACREDTVADHVPELGCFILSGRYGQDAV